MCHSPSKSYRHLFSNNYIYITTVHLNNLFFSCCVSLNFHSHSWFFLLLWPFCLGKHKTPQHCRKKTQKNTSKLYPLSWSQSDSCIPPSFHQPFQALSSSPSFPQSVFNISFLCLFYLLASRPHLEECFDHPEVWRKEPPSSQISYGALLQAWHVYQAESTTHPLQPPAREPGRMGRGSEVGEDERGCFQIHF